MVAIRHILLALSLMLSLSAAPTLEVNAAGCNPNANSPC